MSVKEPPLLCALVAGGMAGTAVDIALFPLDTLKTRLQSAKGFMRSGGFRGIYSGLGSAAVGSAPNAAVFFCSYEFVKKIGKHVLPDSFNSITHMIAATCGEVGFRGLYRGFNSTVIREVPFSLVQFPIWEYLKRVWSQRQNKYVESWQASVCGAVAGGIAAFVTTPLDVAKTRIMLAEKGSKIAEGNIVPVLQAVWLEKGIKGLYAGVIPRMMWISLGGAIFLGVYEKTKSIIMNNYIRDE